MRQALLIALVLWASFMLASALVDYRTAVGIGFAATTLISATNCGTFLWLWYVRATPLALGMSLSWAGQAALSVWWLLTGMPGKTSWLERDPSVFLILSVFMVGGGLHIVVIQNSTGMARSVVLWPAIVVAAIAAGVVLTA